MFVKKLTNDRVLAELKKTILTTGLKFFRTMILGDDFFQIVEKRLLLLRKKIFRLFK